MEFVPSSKFQPKISIRTIYTEPKLGIHTWKKTTEILHQTWSEMELEDTAKKARQIQIFQQVVLLMKIML